MNWKILKFLALIILTLSSCNTKRTSTNAGRSAQSTETSTSGKGNTDIAPIETATKSYENKNETIVEPDNNKKYISLNKLVLAGDYYAIRIDNNGNYELTRFRRDYEIIDRKKGLLDPDISNDLFLEISNVSFSEIEKEYLNPPEENGGEDLVYEDIFYWLEYFNGIEIHSSLFHEYASPKILEEIIQKIFNILIEESSLSLDSGYYFIGVERKLISYINGPEFSQYILEMDKSNPLIMAIINKNLLVDLQANENESALQLFSQNEHVIEITVNGTKGGILKLKID